MAEMPDVPPDDMEISIPVDTNMDQGPAEDQDYGDGDGGEGFDED